jgi:hypothetical protein
MAFAFPFVVRTCGRALQGSAALLLSALAASLLNKISLQVAIAE